MNKKLNIPMLILLVGIATIIISLFIPYVSATEEYAKILNISPNTPFYEKINMTNREAMNLSLFDMANIYYHGANIFYKYFVPIAMVTIGIFSLLNILFSVLKKPIAVIVFDVLTVGTFALLNWDFQDRGIFTNKYNFLISYYLFYIAVMVIFIGAVWLLINKIKDKKKSIEY